jgi:hypothetical protein
MRLITASEGDVRDADHERLESLEGCAKILLRVTEILKDASWWRAA